MTDRELFAQAVVALEYHTQQTRSISNTNLAIEALRARLAQPEPEPYDQTALELCEVCGWKTLIPDDGCLNCARNSKPIAFWRHSSSIEKGWHEFGAKKTSDNDIPLYTAPPQREWQTLTENEIKHLWYEACQTNLELTSQLIVHLARNIEAKLKEKNSA